MTDREEFEGYGLGRKSRTDKVAAKRRSVNSTSTVSLPILKFSFESELKILRATPGLGTNGDSNIHILPAGARADFSVDRDFGQARACPIYDSRAPLPTGTDVKLLDFDLGAG